MSLTIIFNSTEYNSKKLNGIIDNHFNLEELKELCFNLNIDYDNLSGETKKIKISELIKYLNRRSNLKKLIELIQTTRPNIIK